VKQFLVIIDGKTLDSCFDGQVIGVYGGQCGIGVDVVFFWIKKKKEVIVLFCRSYSVLLNVLVSNSCYLKLVVSDMSGRVH
jgi:hypothetical protein